jgi:large subunit ribosomal protein L10
MARPEKVKQIEELAQLFTEARSVVLNDFTGLDVEKLSKLRKQCRENGVEYRVIKNTLALRSLKGTQGEGLEQYFEGPTALAVSRESENLAAKILAKFAEEYEAPKFKAAVVEGNIIDATEVLALAKLPSRDELLSTLLGALKSPGNSLVSVLQGTVRNLLYVVNAIIEKKQSEPGGGEAADTGEGSE